MRRRISIRGHVRPSVRPSVRRSVGPYVPRYFRTTNMAIFEGKRSSNDIMTNDTMSDDEVVASDVPPRYLFTITFTCFQFEELSQSRLRFFKSEINKEREREWESGLIVMKNKNKDRMPYI